KKGSLVFIEGKLKTRSWEDKSGVKRYTTEVIADEMKMLEGKKQESTPQGEPKQEDVPF
ncbi:MAG: single-stranded DNA-binding protein, partial [Deltaproteobacteria bacterium]|nr:single-stranded DNA-binding protein [Deltaproteobacteria bacterium]